jgi:hypothetical protein
VLKENIFRSTGAQTQKAAVYIQSNGIQPELINNQMEGHPEGEILKEK